MEKPIMFTIKAITITKVIQLIRISVDLLEKSKQIVQNCEKMCIFAVVLWLHSVVLCVGGCMAGNS